MKCQGVRSRIGVDWNKLNPKANGYQVYEFSPI